MLSKQTKRKLLLFFLPRIVWALLWVLYLTSRRRFHLHEAMMHKNFVAAFWHGEFLMLPFLYRYAKKQMSQERAKGFYHKFAFAQRGTYEDENGLHYRMFKQIGID